MKNYISLSLTFLLICVLSVSTFAQKDTKNISPIQTDTRNIDPPQSDFAVYDFSQLTTTYTSIVGAPGEVVLAAGTLDDETYANRNIGFTFSFDSTAFTTFGVSANGYIIMGSGAVPNNYTVLNFTQNDAIAAFCGDLQSYAGTGKLSYVVTGAPPIRVLTIQWTDFGFWTNAGPDTTHANFQIKLYEGSNIVQLVYGTSTSGNFVRNVQAGLRGNSTADVSSRFSTTSWSTTTPGTSTATVRFQTGIVPPTGLTFQYAPPAIVSQLCENFTPATFPPTGWSVTAIGTTYLSRAAVSNLCLGSGSMKFDFFTWTSGTQSITTPIFPPAVNGSGCDSVRFFHAKSGSMGGTDVLQIQTSNNGGATWSELVLLSTALNTAPPQGTAFTPTCVQWGRKAYQLPAGTNRVRFNATTAHDNNLYLDSICVACLTGIGTPNNQNPEVFSLSQNYPNPFNPATKIEYQLPQSGFVTLKIYDVLGHEVASLVDAKQNRGLYSASFDGTNYASGVYFYEIQVKDASDKASFTERKKMVLIK